MSLNYTHFIPSKANYIIILQAQCCIQGGGGEELASDYWEAHFVYLWMEASPEERLVLASLSRMISLTGHVTLV